MTTKIFIPVALVIVTLTGSCTPISRSPTPTRSDEVRLTAQEYFRTFAARADWEKLCAFYREDVQFEDVILQLSLDSLWQFKRFYNWEGEGDAFAKLTPGQDHLTVESLVANDSIAVARGRVNPFYYHGELVDKEWGMDFTIWLYFDDQLRIWKQVDWFEYGDDVLENVVERYRTQGVDEPPSWLNLSRDN